MLKSAQNCGICSFILKICPKSIRLQKLQKFTKIWDFTFFQVLFFEHVEEVPRHDLTVWIPNPMILHMPFLLSKTSLLYLNFSIPPCEKSRFSLGFIGPMRIKLCRHEPNSLRNKKFEETHVKFPSKIGFFGSQNPSIPIATREKKLVFQLWTLWSHKWWGIWV